MSKEEILVHACCATCACYVLQKIALEYTPVIYYYNPNIYPLEEYIRRRDELKNYASHQNIRFIEEIYKHDEWSKFIIGLEKEPEKGQRCDKCFLLRLEKTASYALENNIKAFTTTLTISPHKNSKTILKIGNNIAKDKKIFFLATDFKKQDGYEKTVEIAKKERFYRQNYCGCLYSLGNL
jgi:hypothetical protein